MKSLCGESDDESINLSDSDDDDWIPNEPCENEVSDNEEYSADKNDSTPAASDVSSESEDDNDTNVDVDAVSTAGKNNSSQLIYIFFMCNVFLLFSFFSRSNRTYVCRER